MQHAQWMQAKQVIITADQPADAGRHCRMHKCIVFCIARKGLPAYIRRNIYPYRTGTQLMQQALSVLDGQVTIKPWLPDTRCQFVKSRLGEHQHPFRQ
ncbi:MAG: hypothetical protein A2Z95_00765 [Gallionellales bacterium GWA2_60_18]|nr:MAG: hypothetical protein A2Z95_00765 [Gallionellales bacterium GWA2_60_18]